MIENDPQFRGGIVVLVRERCDRSPPRRRVADLGPPLVKFGKADQCHQVTLVGRKSEFERIALGGIIARKALRFCKVEP